MNVDNLKKVRSKIANVDNFFRMDYWHVDSYYVRTVGHDVVDHENNVAPECGTASCIGGWCDAIMVEELTRVDFPGPAEWLGLNEYEAEQLFHNEMNSWALNEKGERKNLSGITRAETIEYLDKCIEAGKLV